MHAISKAAIAAAVIWSGSAAILKAAPAGDTLEMYQRAERTRAGKILPLALNLSIAPVWTGSRDRFWYRLQAADGWQYLAVDPQGRETREAFDHVRLAAAVSQASGQSVDAKHLAFGEPQVDEARHRLSFGSGDKLIACDLASYTCTAAQKPHPDPLSVISPDGTMAVFAKADNLWLRMLPSGTERQLTHDGEPHFSYGKMPDAALIAVLQQSTGKNFPPYGVQWSPDSRRLVVTRADERALPDYFFLQSVPYDGTLRPKVLTVRTGLSGEAAKATAEVSVIVVGSGDRVVLKTGPDGLSKTLWWSADNSHFFVLEGGDYSRSETLFDVNASTGALRPVLKEQGRTFLQISPLEYDEPAVRYLDRSHEFIWFSQRDGWNHLYLVDTRTGAIKAKLGDGPWSVQSIVYVDAARRLIYFSAAGREPRQDPYYRHLYVVRFDGGGLKLLTPEAADHIFPAKPNPALLDSLTALGFVPSPLPQLFSPSGKYFLDTWSRFDLPPQSVLRASDGKLVMELAKADVSGVVKAGWLAPELVSAKAADGTSAIYGLLIKPPGFESSRRYPVVECIYNGPQVVTTPHDYEGALSNWMANCAQSFAQLGFITFVMDGRGTPMRSKAFQDYMYNNMQEFALEDHVAFLKSLAAERPYLDISRLGVIGHSFGGFTAMKAILGYPDFYKVAVASAGPYNMYGMYPLDAFFPPPVFAEQEGKPGARFPTNWGNVDLTRQADRLKGKLLMAYADLDENAYPAVSVQMVNALIAANKEFDLIYMPNRSHAFSGEPYFIRRTWDYMVRNLMGAEPPKDYRFDSAPAGK
ncbi:MAG TPA: DPP IV N-terminal domain-containing protein [Steroidobacteraceae bacterium]|nr:DPP IV N-terminal domain-containing protein [Steroidobacteraceae bacterium]